MKWDYTWLGVWNTPSEFKIAIVGCALRSRGSKMRIKDDTIIAGLTVGLVFGLLSWFGLFIYGNYRVCSVY
jgi:hypothetical protein